jgi:hypothetical protein
MLMIVPLMIWSARTEMESQAWSRAMATEDRIARTKAMTSAGVRPKNADGSAGSSGARMIPTIQPTNAAVSIIPSMPMLTTPDRSHITPHNAASTMGVADWRMIGAFSGRTWMR